MITSKSMNQSSCAFKVCLVRICLFFLHLSVVMYMYMHMYAYVSVYVTVCMYMCMHVHMQMHV